MIYNVNFFIVNLILDFAIIEMLNLFLKLFVSKIELSAIMVFSTFPSLVYIFFQKSYFCFVVAKLITYFVLSMLLTDKYNFKKIFEIFVIMMFSMFSVFGFAEFFILFVKNIIFDIFGIKLDIFYNFLILIALFLYIILIVLMFGNLTKKKNISNFLFDVSFLLFNNHIQITGFLDSGNNLYDTITGKCVVIVSLDGIKKFISKTQYEKLLVSDYNVLGISNEIECEVVGGNKIYLPVIDVGEIELKQSESSQTKNFSCVIAITKEKFAESENYDCLLHREFC